MTSSNSLRAFIRIACVLTVCAGVLAEAAQFGPVFPTHRFPTDESFHLSYRFSNSWTHSNFVAARSYQSLTDTSRFTLIEHQFIPEFQPNRQLSLGAIMNVVSAALNPGTGTGAGVSTVRLGDQRVFVEYRLFDAPGRSVGLAFVPKFPGYKNPTAQQITEANATRAVLLGDAQIDLPILLTTEFWPSTTFRAQLDAGLNFRTQGFAKEAPFQVSAAFVNPRLQLELRMRGNVALGTSTAGTADELDVRKAFAGSEFAYSESPWTVILQPAAEMWITPSVGASFDFSYAVMGNHAPRFAALAFGLSFRQAQTRRTPRRTFQEVDIGTDQEAGQFQGELQMQEEPGPAAPAP